MLAAIARIVQQTATKWEKKIRNRQQAIPKRLIAQSKK
jgi:hypothetical protein